MKHPYHLVDISPWPLLISFSILSFAINIINWIKNKEITISIILALILIIFISYLWWRDIIREGRKGDHTKKVQKGLLLGFILFIISEIMLFFSLFWTFFHSSLAPAIDLGNIWPPLGINSMNYLSLPLLGTSILLASGFILTLSHESIIYGNKSNTIRHLILTILLGICFLILQLCEYNYGEFNFSDSIYGSIFYLTTGLHGLHVLVGVIFLIVGLIRIYFDNFTSEHHLGFEFAIYYWHFVDIVWLFVFIFYYWWGS
jgi:cytochrome c oxidase subunit 3